jgi:uncharacterized protein
MITSFCHRFAAALLFAAALPACAASFDCTRAKLDFEKAVCSDKNLSNLDEKLASAYKDLADASNNPAALRADQRDWGRGRSECMKDQGKSLACLARSYIDRTRLLTLAANAFRAPGAKSSFKLNDVSQKHDFEVRMLEPCRKPRACDGAAIVLVLRKGESTPQSFVLQEHMMIMDQLLETIRTGDYNQDGIEDFALRVGSQDDYSQPFYVYFSSNSDGNFTYSPEITDLAQSATAGVDVDEETGELTTIAGNSTHEFERYWYKLVNGKIINTRRLDVKDDPDAKYALFTYYNWKNGKWVRDRIEKHR